MEHSSLQSSAKNSDDAAANSAPHKWAKYITRSDKDDIALRIESAKVLVRSVLELREKLHKRQFTEFLSLCIWKLSEAEPEHKHRTRYRTAAVQDQIKRENRCDSKNLRHDHVFERRLLIKDFESAANAKDKVEAERLLAEAFAKAEVACTVTRKEHDEQLRSTGGYGWERYHSAGIEIIDTLTGRRGVPDRKEGNIEPFV